MSAAGNGIEHPEQGELGLDEASERALETAADEPEAEEAHADAGGSGGGGGGDSDDGDDGSDEAAKPNERTTTQLIINKEGRFRVLADGTREAMGQEAWQAELTRRFNRSE